MKKRKLYLAILVVVLFAATISGQETKPKEEAQVPKDRISIDDLKRKLDAKEEIVIIDTRAGSAWVGSLVKIKGAIHITTDQLESRMNELPKDKDVITYCT